LFLYFPWCACSAHTGCSSVFSTIVAVLPLSRFYCGFPPFCLFHGVLVLPMSDSVCSSVFSTIALVSALLIVLSTLLFPWCACSAHVRLWLLVCALYYCRGFAFVPVLLRVLSDLLVDVLSSLFPLLCGSPLLRGLEVAISVTHFYLRYFHNKL